MALERNTFAATGNGDAVGGNGRTALVAMLSGTWVGTVLLELSYDGGSNWDQHTSTTSNTQIVIDNFPSELLARWRCSAYTSGTVVAGIGT